MKNGAAAYQTGTANFPEQLDVLEKAEHQRVLEELELPRFEHCYCVFLKLLSCKICMIIVHSNRFP